MTFIPKNKDAPFHCHFHAKENSSSYNIPSMLTFLQFSSECLLFLVFMNQDSVGAYTLHLVFIPLVSLE